MSANGKQFLDLNKVKNAPGKYSYIDMSDSAEENTYPGVDPAPKGSSNVRGSALERVRTIEANRPK